MAGDEPAGQQRRPEPAPAAAAAAAHHKLPPLPKGYRIQKRPIPRRRAPPAGPPGSASASPQTRLIYVPSSGSFMSVVRRAQKHLDRAHREAGPSLALKRGKKTASLADRVRALENAAAAGGEAEAGGRGGGAGGAYAVVLLGTGRAIERTLGLAAWFEQRRGEYVVEMRTRTVGAVDDLVRRPRQEGAGQEGGRQEGGADSDGQNIDKRPEGRGEDGEEHEAEAEADGEGQGEADGRDRQEETGVEEQPVEDSRVRMVSCLEVTIRMRI